MKQQQKRRQQQRRRKNKGNNLLLPLLPFSHAPTSEATPPRHSMPASATSPSTRCCAIPQPEPFWIGSEAEETFLRGDSAAALLGKTTTMMTGPSGSKKTRSGAYEPCDSLRGSGSPSLPRPRKLC